MSTARPASAATPPAATHEPRVTYEAFKDLAPEIYTAMGTLSAKASAGLEKDLVELVKLRASQINGCAFCLQLHLNVARAAKVPASKLDLLAAWRDAGIYSAREATALAWTEVLTRLSSNVVTDADYQAVRQAFTEQEVAHLSTTIGVINVWNRICTGFAFAPPIPAAA